jgi:putative toxin-antitoxin system antitoxin component (TIGR02293 family)
MTQNQIALLANISIQTYKRKPHSTPLSLQLSERVLLLQDLYAIGMNVFDSNLDLFQYWLKSSVPALQNQKPNDLLTSLIGIDVVKEELLRIEHGVY